jgi:hypothetical protein
METARFIKDPNAVLDYQWDWSDWLPTGDTIATADVSLSTGNVVISSESNTTTTVTAWVAGGTDQTESRLTARVVTAQGRTDDRSIILAIVER